MLAGASRPIRRGPDDAHARRVLAKEAADAAERSPRADACHERVEAPLTRFENLGTGGIEMRRRIGGVLELIRRERSELLGDAFRASDVPLGIAGLDVGA